MWNKQGQKWTIFKIITATCLTNVFICKVEIEVCENRVKIKAYFVK